MNTMFAFGYRMSASSCHASTHWGIHAAQLRSLTVSCVYPVAFAQQELVSECSGYNSITFTTCRFPAVDLPAQAQQRHVRRYDVQASRHFDDQGSSDGHVFPPGGLKVITECKRNCRCVSLEISWDAQTCMGTVTTAAMHGGVSMRTSMTEWPRAIEGALLQTDSGLQTWCIMTF